MALVRYLFRASLLLWAGAIITALAGHFFGWDALTALSFGFRRFAPAVTLIWLVVAIGRMIWVRFWPFRGAPKQPLDDAWIAPPFGFYYDSVIRSPGRWYPTMAPGALPVGEQKLVRHFRWISIVMVAAGLVVAALALVLPLDPFWILGGAMLVISGVVKLVVLHLWRELVQPGTAPSPIVPRKR